MTTIAGVDVNKLQRNLNKFLKLKIDKNQDLKMLQIMVGRRGELLYNNVHGEAKNDTIYKIYSMTKCVVSVGLCQLYEKGLFSLNDPLSKFIPAFKDMKVIMPNPDNTINPINEA